MNALIHKPAWLLILTIGFSFTAWQNVQAAPVKLTFMTGDMPESERFIALNQLGFYPDLPKLAIVRNGLGNSFYVVSADRQDTLFTGKTGPGKFWEFSDQEVSIADFSAFSQTGSYTIHVPGIGYSASFTIEDEVYQDLSRALAKMFYYQRASTSLEPEYAGVWPRPFSHPDLAVEVHPSAASENRPAGTLISSPGGWYDAGDYNKYIVASGITMHMLMMAYEQFYDYVNGLDLNIPESGNDIPDILDEVLWNLRWMFTMQDPGDGGVYHKLTNASFESPDVPPQLATKKRYVVQKSTAATLDFAANMAQAARIFNRFELQLPGLKDSCLTAAEYAWNWARDHPRVAYDQANLGSPAISTGQYKDSKFSDELLWAASELYITTGKSLYLNEINISSHTYSTPYWGNVESLALISLSRYKEFLSTSLDTKDIDQRIIDMASPMLTYADQSAFRVPMGYGSSNFEWGSNGKAAFQSVMLVQAYLLTGLERYLHAALANFDYILGRNPLLYSFVTGFGHQSPLHPHHRPSENDGVAAPIPGMLVGGPHPGQQDAGWCNTVDYPSSLPALSYLDDYCSYASNEITIYWNAPLTYISMAFEAIKNQMVGRAFDPRLNSGGTGTQGSAGMGLRLYPNPASDCFNIRVRDQFSGGVTLYDISGRILHQVELHLEAGESHSVDIPGLASGLYFVGIRGEHGLLIEKLMMD